MPAITLTGAEFVMTRSACRLTVELALAEATTGGRPGAVPVTFRLVVITVPLGVAGLTKKTILKTAVSLGADGRGAKLLLLQMIVPVPPTDGVVQAQPAGMLMDWNVVLAGVAIVKTVSSATSGQGFVTVTSTLRFDPASTVGG